MHHELLSTTMCALAALQHPSLHTCPHTLRQRWQTDVVCRQDLKLPLVFRVQVGSEATEFILLVDNATSVPQILHAGAYFAALEMPSVHASAGACVVEGGWRRFARALVTADGCLLVSMY